MRLWRRLTTRMARFLDGSEREQQAPKFQISEDYIGGRLLKGMPLLPGEHVIMAGDAECRRSLWTAWTAGWGALFLTNKRLIHCPEKPLIGGPFWWPPLAIQLQSIGIIEASTGVLSNLSVPKRIDVKTGHKRYSFGFGWRGGKERKDWLVAIEKAVRECGPTDEE